MNAFTLLRNSALSFGWHSAALFGFAALLCLTPLMFGCGQRSAKVDKEPVKVDTKQTEVEPEYSRWNTTNYYEWTKHFVEQPMRFDVKLGITTTTGEEYASGATNREGVDAFMMHRYHFGSTVYTNGCIGCFASHPFGTMGGQRPQLSEADLRRLDELISKLPDDGSRLPPPGRRVEVTVREGDHWRVRVYDGTKPPPEVVEIRSLVRDIDVPVRSP